MRRLVYVPLAILLAAMAVLVSTGPSPADAAPADYWPKPGQAKLYRYDDGMFRIALAGGAKEGVAHEWRVTLNGGLVVVARPRQHRIRLIQRQVHRRSVVEVFRDDELRHVWRVHP